MSEKLATEKSALDQSIIGLNAVKANIASLLTYIQRHRGNLNDDVANSIDTVLASLNELKARLYGKDCVDASNASNDLHDITLKKIDLVVEGLDGIIDGLNRANSRIETLINEISETVKRIMGEADANDARAKAINELGITPSTADAGEKKDVNPPDTNRANLHLKEASEKRLNTANEVRRSTRRKLLITLAIIALALPATCGGCLMCTYVMQPSHRATGLK